MKFFRQCMWAVIFCGLAVLSAETAGARVIDGGSIMDQRMRENLCALTFDDGPTPNTPKLLDMLSEYGIPATFFLLGSQAERYPHLVRRMVEEGHEVGNHSYSHPNLRLISSHRKEEEIRRTHEILAALDATPVLLRPPYGSYDKYTEEVAENLGMSVLLWSMDSRDWKALPVNYAALRSARGTVYAPGALRGVFLFHDTHKRTVDDLPRIIRDLREGGCQRFVTVSEYLEGMLDPEPGLLMTRRPQQPSSPESPASAQAARPAGEPALAARHTIKGVESTEERESFPAGTGPVPLARSSKPWQTEPPAALPPGQAMGQPLNQPLGQSQTPPATDAEPVAPGSGQPHGAPPTSSASAQPVRPRS